jgi:hypothetical protein
MKFALIPPKFLPLYIQLCYHCNTFDMTLQSVECIKEELCPVMGILRSESVRAAGIYGILTVQYRN